MASLLISSNINHYFDMAAVIISLLLLICYVSRKIFFTYQGKLFALMALLNLIQAISNILTTEVNMAGANNLALKYIVHIPNLLCYTGLSCIFFFYIMAFARGYNPGEYSKWVLVVPIITAIEYLLIITTPFTKWICDMSVSGYYQTGPLYYLLYFFGMVIFFIDIVVLSIPSYRVVSEGKKTSIWSGLMMSLISTVVQMLVPSVMLVSFGTALVLILIYATLENPSNFFFQDELCYNATAFFQKSYRFFTSNEKWVVYVGVEESQYIHNLLSYEKFIDLNRNFVGIYKKSNPKGQAFYMGKTTYAFYVDDDPETFSKNIIEAFFQGSHMDKDSVSLTPYACIMSNKDAENIEMLKMGLDIFSSRKDSSSTKQRVSYITKAELDYKEREADIVQVVKDAIKNDTIHVFYQPILFEKSNRFEAAEVVVRIRDKKLGNITPKEFIPIVEQNGLILPLGELVFTHVCKFISENDLRRRGIAYVEINLSTLQCMQYDLSDRLIGIMSQYDIDPKMINLEINESAYIADKEMVIKNVLKLKEYGVNFSLDDFGTGFSNAEYLSVIPIKHVSFSGSLVSAAMEDRLSLIMLKNYISLIKDLNYECIAKGIENSSMEANMRELGCDAFQGYYYSRAMAEEDYLRFLNDR